MSKVNVYVMDRPLRDVGGRVVITDPSTNLILNPTVARPFYQGEEPFILGLVGDMDSLDSRQKCPLLQGPGKGDMALYLRENNYPKAPIGDGSVVMAARLLSDNGYNDLMDHEFFPVWLTEDHVRNHGAQVENFTSSDVECYMPLLRRWREEHERYEVGVERVNATANATEEVLERALKEVGDRRKQVLKLMDSKRQGFEQHLIDLIRSGQL